jgi:putative ABC transport system permease protein
MWRLVVGALLARRGQSAVLFLLAALAVTAGAAAPMYASAASQAAGLDQVREATGADRAISARNPRMPGDDAGAIEAVRENLRTAARGSDLTDFLALDLRATLDPLRAGAKAATVTVLAREGVCEHVAVTGRCARDAGEAVVSAAGR